MRVVLLVGAPSGAWRRGSRLGASLGTHAEMMEDGRAKGEGLLIKRGHCRASLSGAQIYQATKWTASADSIRFDLTRLDLEPHWSC